MKKYLMIAFAALAVVSCSKMDDVTLTQGEIDQNRYDAAFKKYLLDGKSIAPNQTWGFSADAYSSAAPAFTRSTSNGTEDTTDLRIIAEDLSATGASDFDFNDVVLDVTFGSPAKVVLVAAGGTLPLRINGNNALEVHKLFGVLEADADLEAITEKLVMVNTGAGASKATVDITSQVNVSISTPAEADSKLKLEVFKNGEWQEMKAPMGEPACKLAVDPTFKILTERKSIKNEYPLFVEWATATNFTSKWW